MLQLPNILVQAIPGFILLIIAEIAYAIKMQREVYEVKDTATSISLGIGNLLVGIFYQIFHSSFFLHGCIAFAFLLFPTIHGGLGFYAFSQMISVTTGFTAQAIM